MMGQINVLPNIYLFLVYGPCDLYKLEQPPITPNLLSLWHIWQGFKATYKSGLAEKGLMT